MTLDASVGGVDVVGGASRVRRADFTRVARLPTAILPATWRHQTVVAGVAWLALAGLLIVGGPRHEPWFDEAQAWLIARDSNPVAILTHWMHYEGTPGLWHLLLWGLQRLGLGYARLYLVSSAFALMGSWLVLFRSPFPLWMRLGLCFSYLFAYQYAVIARSYSLDLLFVPAIATMFAGRRERPLAYGAVLGLLANANAHSFVLSVPLGIEFAWPSLARISVALRTDRRTLGGLAIYGVSALAAAAQATPPLSADFLNAGGLEFMPARAVSLLLEGFLERANIATPLDVGLYILPGGLLLTLLLLVPATLLCRAAGWLNLWAGLLGALFVSVLFVGNYWHSGLFFLTLLLCLWVSWEALPKLPRWGRAWLLSMLAVTLLYNLAYTASAWRRDISEPYSAGRAAAAEIAALQASHPADRFAASGFKSFSVQPMLTHNAFANFSSTQGAFETWSRRSGVPLYPTRANWRALTRTRAYDWLLLSADTGDHNFSLAPFRRIAAAQGYCVARVFPGQLIWKMRVSEPDSLVLFGRCGALRL